MDGAAALDRGSRGLVGIHLADVSLALDAGLTFRPLEATVRDTLALAQPTETAGLAPEREADLLAGWSERSP